MKQNNYQYFNVKSVKNDNVIEFESIKDFHRYIELVHQKSVFLLAENTQSNYFAVVHNGGLIQQQTLGYKTLEDYFTATENGFHDAQNYYEALAGGFLKYEDFKLVKEAAISDKQEFEKIKNGGYIEGFAEMIKDGKETSAVFANPNELYRHASAKGFSSYNNYKEAISKGFSDAETYVVARDKKFENA
ncbi:MAG: hypothetical protein LH473_00335 [Chitinophagales bacterium]|nr:hypothetical protein [Chitinophagales bacterium]